MKLTLTKTTIQHHHYWLASSPVGLAFIGRADGAENEWQQFYPTATASIDQTGNQTAIQALRAYLSGQPFDPAVALDLTPGTPFQQRVWQALRQIPYGQTRSYSELATSIARPRAVRAVASAVAHNPLLMAVPCHRIIRKDGQLGNYRGGVAMKRALLTLEDVHYHACGRP